VLHDMERAPGFTRANLGLLLIRMGDFAEGFGLISTAAQLDPEMRMDPNFRRHLAIAIGSAPMNASISMGSTIAEGRIYSPPAPVYPAVRPFRAAIDARRPEMEAQSASSPPPNSGQGEARKYPATSEPGNRQASPAWRQSWTNSGIQSQDASGSRRERPSWRQAWNNVSPIAAGAASGRAPGNESDGRDPSQ